MKFSSAPVARAIVAACALSVAFRTPVLADVVRTARAIRELTEPEARAGKEAELQGLVMCLVDPRGTAIVVQDATDPIYIIGPRELVRTLEPGNLVRVHGRTAPGAFAPIVEADRIEKIGVGAIPPPARISSEDLFSRGLDAAWVLLTGIVRQVQALGPDEMRGTTSDGRPSRRFKVTLAVGDRLVPVQYYGWLDPETLVDSEVEIRGLVFSQHNPERQFLNPSVAIGRASDIRILIPPPNRPFQGPVIPAGELFKFKRQGESLHRVNVAGVVLHQEVGTGVWIRDGDTGLFVESGDVMPLSRGDRVLVAGFPQRGRFSPVLADAVYKRVEHGGEPEPIQLDNQPTAARHNGDLVNLEGILTGQRESDDGTVLRVEWQKREIAAIYHSRANVPVRRFGIGSVVAISGICIFSSPADAPVAGVLVPGTFSLLVRSQSDIRVVRPAPWWHGERFAIVLGSIVAVLAGILIAVSLASRHRLAREQARRAHEAAEYGARLAERSRMARELHDTVAQGLGAISLQLELAAKEVLAPARSDESHLKMAQQLVRSSMLEVRSFIRNLRTQTQLDVELASALRELLTTAVDGTGIAPVFSVQGEPHRLASAIETQVLWISQEAISNAVRHSQANEIALTVEYLTSELAVTVADHGVGFDRDVDWGKRLHFGLLGMKERAALISAVLTISTGDGRGTRIRLIVPKNAVVRDSFSI
jgi:signal transduction histidine kinase